MGYLTSKNESVDWQLSQFSYPKKLIRAEILKGKKEGIDKDEYNVLLASRFFVTTCISSSQRPILSNSLINKFYPSIPSEFEEPSPTSDFELIDLILEKSWLPMYIRGGKIEDEKAFFPSLILESESEQEKRIIDESLNYCIVMKYKKLEFVNSVFFQKYRKELRYDIYFKSEHYDSNIMDQLISNELDMLDSYPDLHFDFNYCPSKIEKKAYSLGKYIQKIYERK